MNASDVEKVSPESPGPTRPGIPVRIGDLALRLTLAAGLLTLAIYVVTKLPAGVEWAAVKTRDLAANPLTWPVLGLLAVVALYALGALLTDLLGIVIVWAGRARWALRRKPRAQHHVVVCIDGTWNHPGQLAEGQSAETNVVRFWRGLEGGVDRVRQRFFVAADGFKQSVVDASDADDADRGSRPRRQIALYYRGVGNRLTNTALGQALGGVFGFGAQRILRNVTQDLIKYHTKTHGDLLTIVGYSRGAAIARLIASRIEAQGIPRWSLFSTMLGYPIWRLLAPFQPVLRQTRLRELLAYDARVNFLGAWDTVASFGVARNVGPIPFQRVNLFKSFAVATAVDRAVHLLAMDDPRESFLPTPMRGEKGEGQAVLTEVWFPGVHGNVGGGVADDSLSTVTLEYMVLRTCEWASAAQNGYWIHHSDPPTDTRGRWSQLTARGTVPDVRSPIYGSCTRQILEGAVLHWTVVVRILESTTPVRSTALLDHLERLETYGVEASKIREAGRRSWTKHVGSLDTAEPASPEFEIQLDMFGW